MKLSTLANAVCRTLYNSAQHAIHDMQYTGMDEHMSGQPEAAEMLHRARLWVALFVDFPRYFFTSLRCEVSGHDWVDTSHGGPESGDMSGYCERCGFSFHHQLY